MITQAAARGPRRQPSDPYGGSQPASNVLGQPLGRLRMSRLPMLNSAVIHCGGKLPQARLRDYSLDLSLRPNEEFTRDGLSRTLDARKRCG